MNQQEKGGLMPVMMEKGAGLHVAKVVEITSASPKSFEDAISAGIARASKTLEGIQGAWIKDQKVVVKDGKIMEFRVDMKVTFLLKE
jgi:flavin-binding protein dodecin